VASNIALRLAVTTLVALAPIASTALAAPMTGAPPGAIIRSHLGALHLLCTGSGTPTVLLDAGIGGNSLDWTLLQPKLARSNRVCSYDWAGAGWSEPSQRPRTLDNIADELHAMIAVAALDVPLIVIGHSFGGLSALHYARRYPSDVAGLVLLDSTHPDQFRRFQEIGIALPDPYAVVAHTPASAAAYGLPADLHRIATDLAAAPKARDAMLKETVAMSDNADMVRQEGLPRLPSRVVVHGNHEWDRLYPDGRMEAAWLDMQQQLARNLGAPPPLIAGTSGHQIALDNPDLVLAVIHELMSSLGLRRNGGDEPSAQR
jgi:pimeloyl-ACP methyl ester carboxylesterase